MNLHGAVRCAAFFAPLLCQVHNEQKDAGESRAGLRFQLEDCLAVNLHEAVLFAAFFAPWLVTC